MQWPHGSANARVCSSTNVSVGFIVMPSFTWLTEPHWTLHGHVTDIKDVFETILSCMGLSLSVTRRCVHSSSLRQAWGLAPLIFYCCLACMPARSCWIVATDHLDIYIGACMLLLLSICFKTKV